MRPYSRPHHPIPGRLALPALVLLAALCALLAGAVRPAGAITVATYQFDAPNYNNIEGSALTVTITRTGDTTSVGTVAVAITGGTAIAGVDYTPFGTTFNVPFNGSPHPDLSKNLKIGNSIHRPGVNAPVTVTVAITSAGSDNIGVQSTATLTILDADGPLPPAVTAISPHSGPAAGGTALTITGTHFTGAGCGNITFGGTPASTCSISDTQITVTAPAHAAGSVDIRVDNGNGISPATSADVFKYGAGPVIYYLSPNNGPASGGVAITIVGKGFTGLLCSNIYFDGFNPASCGTITDTTAQVVPKAHLTGTVNTQVVVSGIGNPDTVDDDYTYTGSSSLTTISPHTGSTAGGTLVTISGALLGGTTSVTFGGTAGTIQTVTATTVTVLTPAHTAGTVDVVVSGSSGTGTLASAFTFTNGPVVTSVSPAGGPITGGNTVVINGTGFTPSATVMFGGVPAASVSFSNSTQLTVVAPPHAAGVVAVTVTTAAGTSPDTPDDDYLYGSLLPSVTGVSPNGGSVLGGYTVTVTGSGFSSGVLQVLFGALSGTNVIVSGDTSLTVTVPAQAAGTVSVRIVTTAGTSPDTVADNFTYGTQPVVTSVTPPSGPAAGGTFVTITGANFTNATLVTFGGTAAGAFTISDDSTIHVVTPAHSPGIVDVVVSSAAGSSANTLADNFTYTGTAAPSITSITPSSGPIGGGTVVTITGTGFLGATSVKFSGVAGSSLQVVSDSTIKVTVPPAATSGVADVVVTTPLGSNAVTSAAHFTYTGAGAGTFTYTLYSHFNLFSWGGLDHVAILPALQGLENPDNPATNDVSGQVSAIFKWSADGTGCPPGQATCWRAWFPNAGNVPGAVNLSALDYGTAYWFAIRGTASVPWTIISGP